MSQYFLFADIIGIIAFTISGFIVAIRKNLDILGILIASSLTALGGGVIRDAIINTTPFAFKSLYPALTLFLTMLFFYALKLYKKESIERKWLFVLSDTIGLVAFSITGALLAIHAQYNFFGIVTISFITAVGGGVTRDVLINEIPAVLTSDFYGSIAIIIATAFGVLNLFNFVNEFTVLAVGFFSIILRLTAYKKEWHLPRLN